MQKDYGVIFKDFYLDAAREIDAAVPDPLIHEIIVIAFVDSDYAHDRVTRHSVTGLMILLGRTPIFFLSKRQGAIATSTYGAEFCAMHTAVEEVQTVWYMLQCLGVKITQASLICREKQGAVQNCTIPDSL